MQCMWSLLQNEWPEQTIDQAKEEIGKNTYSILFHAHFNEIMLEVVILNLKIMYIYFRAHHGEKVHHVPTAKPAKPHYGEETTMANQLVMPAVFTTNCIM